MAMSIAVEVEAGTYCPPTRLHNGYWAGDFPSHRHASDRATQSVVAEGRPSGRQPVRSPLTATQGRLGHDCA